MHRRTLKLQRKFLLLAGDIETSIVNGVRSKCLVSGRLAACCLNGYCLSSLIFGTTRPLDHRGVAGCPVAAWFCLQIRSISAISV